MVPNMKIKNDREITAMRAGGRILALILAELEKMIAPGINTMDLEIRAEQLCRKYEVKPAFKGYNNYPYILCTAVNERVVHAFPDPKTVLQTGDLISIDCGVIHQGLYTDQAISVIVGSGSAEVEKFLFTAKEALADGIRQARAGNRVGDISAAIQARVEKNGFGIIKDLVGHGVGFALHEAPQIPNFGPPHQGTILKAGLTLAIEPIISMGSGSIKTLANGWDIVTCDGNVACQVEHTVLVTSGAAEILTSTP